jgi:uncharacterized protein with GYD domain
VGALVIRLFSSNGEKLTNHLLKQGFKIKGGLAKPEDRHAAIARLCEQAGGKLLHLYFTLGRYDFLVITDMPDAKGASVVLNPAAAGGHQGMREVYDLYAIIKPINRRTGRTMGVDGLNRFLAAIGR